MTSSLRKLASLEAELEKSPDDISLRTEVLRLLRSSGLHRPRLVRQCAVTFAKSPSVRVDDLSDPESMMDTLQLTSSPGLEFISDYFHACVVLREDDEAEETYKMLKGQFGGSSSRVRMMKGLLCESKGLLKQARRIYLLLLSESQSLLVWKRLVALEKGAGRTRGAIKWLVKIVEVYVNDVEAFMELIDLYLSIEEYRKALFCIEECILSNPKNYFFHVKKGDLHYALGEYLNATKEYSMAVSLHPECLRALYGIVLSAQRTRQPSKTTGRLLEAATKAIEAVYRENEVPKTLVQVAKQSMARD